MTANVGNCPEPLEVQIPLFLFSRMTLQAVFLHKWEDSFWILFRQPVQRPLGRNRHLQFGDPATDDRTFGLFESTPHNTEQQADKQSFHGSTW